MPLVLDTNVLIRFLERGGDYAETFSKFDRLLIPAAVDGEYCAGVDAATRPGQRRQRAFDALLESSAVEYVPAGREVSSEYAKVFRHLQERGTPIPQNDIWIAATALVRHAPLCTLDDHFKNVETLELISLQGGRA